ncbi:MAG: DinB family protein [Planctomycetota bacterium]
MALRDPILAELDRELATTRAVLAAVPAARADFRPHPKSWSAGELATHVVNLLRWLELTLTTRRFDLAPPDAPAPKSPPFTTMAETLRRFDAEAPAARGALAIASDADLELSWTLQHGGRTLTTMPRLACLRTFVLNHLIHHRGQLTVYLRLLDAAVPEVYGPTADSAAPGG